MVTITKEERAELQEELSNANLGFPLPWRLGEDADIVDDDGDAVADCMVENSFTGSSAERYIVAAANAAPKLIDALDAAHARIVELETEQGELHRELARLRGQLATARDDASEMEKKAIAEGGEALALRAEVAALKASTTVVHVDESLRMSMDREIADLKARIAELEACTGDCQ